MYEARQNKEKVCRTFSCSKMGKDSKVSSMTNLLNLQRIAIASKNGETVQRVKTIVIESLLSIFKPTHLTRDAQNVNRRKHYISLGLGNIHYNYAINPSIIPNQMLGTSAPRPVSRNFTNTGTVGINETLILVSHGARYVPIFAYRTPGWLARDIFNSNILPIGYSGQIYLDGCHTGEPGLLGSLRDGTSFAEKFKSELIGLSHAIYGNFTVKGNLGAAMTSGWGTEWIEGDKRSTRLISENMNYLVTHNIPLPPIFNSPNRYVRTRNDTSLFGLINTPINDYRGKFTKVEF